MTFRLSVICDWDSPLLVVATRQDGFFKALEILNKEWEVKFYRIGKEGLIPHPYVPVIQRPSPELLAQSVLKDKPDAILFFRDFTSPTIDFVKNKGIPIAICLTGGPFRDNLDAYQLVFVESDVYKKEFERLGKRVIKAFGIDTEIFKPIKQPKIWDAIFPAYFANWKRHSIFAEALGGKGLAVGWMNQNQETECWRICQEKGTMVLSHVSQTAVAYLLNSSRTCVITSDSSGGSQRTVLESMACNIPVIAMNDSDKTTEYIRDCGVGEIINPDSESIRKAIEKWKEKRVDSRDWILENYSAEIYAQKLKEGILSICPKK